MLVSTLFPIKLREKEKSIGIGPVVLVAVKSMVARASGTGAELFRPVAHISNENFSALPRLLEYAVADIEHFAVWCHRQASPFCLAGTRFPPEKPLREFLDPHELRHQVRTVLCRWNPRASRSNRCHRCQSMPRKWSWLPTIRTLPN